MGLERVGLGTVGAESGWFIESVGEGGSKLSISRKGEDEAFLGDLCVAGEGSGILVSADGRRGKDFIQDKRLFVCNGNEVLRLLVLRRLLLLFDDCIEGDLG